MVNVISKFSFPVRYLQLTMTKRYEEHLSNNVFKSARNVDLTGEQMTTIRLRERRQHATTRSRGSDPAPLSMQRIDPEQQWVQPND